jgi:hypothetical protein
LSLPDNPGQPLQCRIPRRSSQSAAEQLARALGIASQPFGVRKKTERGGPGLAGIHGASEHFGCGGRIAGPE